MLMANGSHKRGVYHAIPSQGRNSRGPRPSAFKKFRAILARIVFATHSIFSIWHVIEATQDPSYWLFIAVPLTLILEGLVTIGQRDGDEYKWFCPSIFICLCGSVPPIWFMEIKMSLDSILDNNNNFTTHIEESLLRIGDSTVEIPSNLPGEIMRQMAEQTLLIVLVVGRWILPKGEITRDELSQLLLAYLAISSDIVELFNVFKLATVRLSLELTLTVLSLWSISLIQFPLIITTAKGQKARYCWSQSKDTPKASLAGNAGSLYLRVHSEPSMQTNPGLRFRKGESLLIHTGNGRTHSSKLVSEPCSCGSCCTQLGARLSDTSVWGIIFTVFLQDGPFFALRLYLIFWKKIFNYTMGFFVCKNALIIAVQVYRIFVICMEFGKDVGGLESEMSMSESELGTLTEKTSVQSTPSVSRSKEKRSRKPSLVDMAAELAEKSRKRHSASGGEMQRKVGLTRGEHTCGSLHDYEKIAMEFGIGPEKDSFEDLAYL